MHFVVIMSNNVNTEWILGGGDAFGGGYPRSSPPCMNPWSLYIIESVDSISRDERGVP